MTPTVHPSMRPGPNRVKIATLLAKGHSQAEIARKLGISRQRVNALVRVIIGQKKS